MLLCDGLRCIQVATLETYDGVFVHQPGISRSEVRRLGGFKSIIRFLALREKDSLDEFFKCMSGAEINHTSARCATSYRSKVFLHSGALQWLPAMKITFSDAFVRRVMHSFACSSPFFVLRWKRRDTILRSFQICSAWSRSATYVLFHIQRHRNSCCSRPRIIYRG
jgi:hypothetical protein